VAWWLERGDIPGGLCVLHRCDNRRCVNPEHLFIGTQQENIQDMHSKKRWNPPAKRYGERNHAARLTDDLVREIRRKAKHQTGNSLAREYGFSQMTINRAIRGISWSHITEEDDGAK
jgi:hypothetical protein